MVIIKNLMLAILSLTIWASFLSLALRYENETRHESVLFGTQPSAPPPECLPCPWVAMQVSEEPLAGMANVQSFSVSWIVQPVSHGPTFPPDPWSGFAPVQISLSTKN